MKPEDSAGPRPTRRGLVRAAAGIAAAAGSGLGIANVAEAVVEAQKSSSTGDSKDAHEPFWGEHQGGITTPAQHHSYFAALDLQTAKRDDVIKMLRAWTAAAAHMAAGETASPDRL